MAKERTNFYEKSGIERERYLELKYLARQYDSMRREERKLRRGEIDRREGENSGWRQSDPTGNAAIGMAMRSRADKIRAIENSARAASPEMYAAVLKCVTQGMNYEQLNPPCGRRQFYAARRRFFVELDRRVG